MKRKQRDTHDGSVSTLTDGPAQDVAKGQVNVLRPTQVKGGLWVSFFFFFAPTEPKRCAKAPAPDGVLRHSAKRSNRTRYWRYGWHGNTPRKYNCKQTALMEFIKPAAHKRHQDGGNSNILRRQRLRRQSEDDDRRAPVMASATRSSRHRRVAEPAAPESSSGTMVAQGEPIIEVVGASVIFAANADNVPVSPIPKTSFRIRWRKNGRARSLRAENGWCQ